MCTHARYRDTRNDDSRLGGFRTYDRCTIDGPVRTERFRFFGMVTTSKLQRT